MSQSAQLKAVQNTMLTTSSHGHSDVGFLRESNEDSFLDRPEKGIFAVADGVGGLPYGALASLLAMQHLDAYVQGSDSCTKEDEFRKISFAIHQNILDSGEIVGGQNGIGTTFSAIRFLGNRFIYAHVGDSAIFRFEYGTKNLTQVSKSHTLAAELLAKHGPDGDIDIPDHYSHTLTRCMGQDIDFDVDVGFIEVNPGDFIMLCTDGITNMIDTKKIAEICEKFEVRDLVHQLIDSANHNGGVDNSTVVCVQVN